MKVLDLFSGIGGFALGLERAGFETICFCDINPFSQKLLAKLWPNMPIVGDIRKLSYKDGVLYYDGQAIYTGRIDVITGGFPCQPFSAAGRRLGTEDDRYLWPEMLRLIAEINPRWVIGENVNGLRSMGIPTDEPVVESRTVTRCSHYDFFSGIYTRQEKMLVNKICEDLDEIGYDSQPIVIPACGIGAPHQRNRIWFIANTKILQSNVGDAYRKNGWPHEQQFGSRRGAADVGDTNSAGRVGRAAEHGQNGREIALGTGADVSNTASIRQSQQGQSIFWRGSEADGEGRSTDAFAGGFGRIWSTEPDVGRVAYGIPDRVDRLTGLGNAVLPQIPEIIGHGIKEIERWLAA